MSLRLRESDVTVSVAQSGAAGYDTPNASPQVFRMYYGDKGIEEVPLRAVLEALGVTLEDPQQADTLCMRAARAYVGSMRPTSPRLSKSDATDNLLWLAPEQSEHFERAEITAQGQPPLEILGHEIDRREFVHLVSYVMTSTALDGEAPAAAVGSDPRLAFIGRFRDNV